MQNKKQEYIYYIWFETNQRPQWGAMDNMLDFKTKEHFERENYKNNKDIKVITKKQYDRLKLEKDLVYKKVNLANAFKGWRINRHDYQWKAMNTKKDIDRKYLERLIEMGDKVINDLIDNDFKNMMDLKPGIKLTEWDNKNKTQVFGIDLDTMNMHFKITDHTQTETKIDTAEKFIELINTIINVIHAAVDSHFGIKPNQKLDRFISERLMGRVEYKEWVQSIVSYALGGANV